jgi:hypothetical protein
VRRAAVAIGSLGSEDKEWILSELPEQDRRALKDSLNELKTLGFLTEQTGNDGHIAFALAEAGERIAEPADRVRVATPAQMAYLLANEPSSLIAQLLLTQRWVWAEKFLMSLPQQRREAIEHAIARGGCGAAPARYDWLAQEVGRRLENLERAGVSRTHGSFFRRAMIWDQLRRLAPSALRKVFAWIR